MWLNGSINWQPSLAVCQRGDGACQIGLRFWHGLLISCHGRLRWRPQHAAEFPVRNLTELVGVHGGGRHLISQTSKAIGQAHHEGDRQHPMKELDRPHHGCFLPYFASSRIIWFFTVFFSNSVKFGPDNPELRMVRILVRMADRFFPRRLQISGVVRFSIQRSFASFVRSSLTPFHRTSTVLIASGGSTTCTSPRPGAAGRAWI